MVAPLLLGISGTQLLPEEREFIQAKRPMGFLLFARSIETVEQTRELCAELVELSATRIPLIAVDQEGGRVQRVRFGGRLPAARIFGEWFESDPEAAMEAVGLSAALLADQLREVGATWQLAPDLDLAHAATHAVIGDRAFSSDPKVVARMGKTYMNGVAKGGCLSCIKHAPGHGRAVNDTHFELPLVEASREELAADLLPFEELAESADFIMTAHIRYTALDQNVPATYSEKILKMMREDWGFKGLILADDVGMKALDGDYVERVKKSLAAGCDVAITALSVLKHGMAGTVYDQENFEALRDADLPKLNERALRYLNDLRLPERELDVNEAKATLSKLWADGPARMGYKLEL
jgi:beta-N-acetylhexosaminidase